MNTETKFLLDTLTKNLVLKVMDNYGYSVIEAMEVA